MCDGTKECGSQTQQSLLLQKLVGIKSHNFRSKATCSTNNRRPFPPYNTDTLFTCQQVFSVVHRKGQNYLYFEDFPKCCSCPIKIQAYSPNMSKRTKIDLNLYLKQLLDNAVTFNDSMETSGIQ